MVTLYVLPNAFVESDYLLARTLCVLFMKLFASATLY
jgi:hypothetical protein